jgi:hypothetical protein
MLAGFFFVQNRGNARDNVAWESHGLFLASLEVGCLGLAFPGQF